MMYVHGYNFIFSMRIHVFVAPRNAVESWHIVLKLQNIVCCSTECDWCLFWLLPEAPTTCHALHSQSTSVIDSETESFFILKVYVQLFIFPSLCLSVFCEL